MTQLSYNEAFDPYHTAFRFIRLASACKFEKPVHFDLFRILDFYLLFPFRLQSMRFFEEDTQWRALSKGYQHLAPYGDLPEDSNLFSRMEPIQKAAVGSLVKTGLASLGEWQLGMVEIFAQEIPEHVSGRIEELNTATTDLISALFQISARYPLLGKDGLKHRSKLMEYRYDAV